MQLWIIPCQSPPNSTSSHAYDHLPTKTPTEVFQWKREKNHVQEPQEKNCCWFGWKESEAEDLMKIAYFTVFYLILLTGMLDQILEEISHDMS